MSDVTFRSHMETHPGKVREQNEDTCDLDPKLGYYAVFDGMGGHNAGDVASKTAREVVAAYVRNHTGNTGNPIEKLLRGALDAASKSIYFEARRNRELHGMGTTAVVCILDGLRAYIGHAGDSRAYLLRDGRLRQLTRDHTVVYELMARGALSAEEALSHPYKSVLSRNIGGKAKSETEISAIELVAGDRLMLCSDGLTGYASIDAVEHVVSGAESPRAACQDLVELALRGGGGDNITVLVLEVGAPVLPEATKILRTTGAEGWWKKRDVFIEAARALDVARSPICAHLAEREALDLIAGNIHEALFHDLEQTTGIHVWTFAENLATGWFEKGGAFSDLRKLFNSLRGAAISVVRDPDERREDRDVLIESALQRGLVVAEMAIASVIAERIRRVEAELAARSEPQSTIQTEGTEQKTIPFLSALKVEPPPPEVASALEGALTNAERDLSENKREDDDQAGECVALAAQSAADYAGDQDMLPSARELIGRRELSEAGFAPLLDALERARIAHLDGLATTVSEPGVAAAATRRIAKAHHALALATAFAVIDITLPVDESLRTSAGQTAKLRAEVTRGERQLTQLERKSQLADAPTIVDAGDSQ